jgi:hypothetical protein
MKILFLVFLTSIIIVYLASFTSILTIILILINFKYFIIFYYLSIFIHITAITFNMNITLMLYIKSIEFIEIYEFLIRFVPFFGFLKILFKKGINLIVFLIVLLIYFITCSFDFYSMNYYILFNIFLNFLSFLVFLLINIISIFLIKKRGFQIYHSVEEWPDEISEN